MAELHKAGATVVRVLFVYGLRLRGVLEVTEGDGKLCYVVSLEIN